MAKKWKKKEIEDYISTKQISQENYVAPTVEIGTAPSYKSVANTVDTFNNVSNNIKNKTTMSFDDKEPTTGQKLGFIGKSAGAGLTSGLTGIVDAPLQNIQEGAQKGKKKGKLENYLQGLARTLDIYGLSTMPETAKEVQQITQDKSKSGWQKALNIGGAILNNNPLVNNLEAAGQQLNIVDKNAEKDIKKAREIVETPSNKLNESVAKDSEKMSGGWKIAGEVSQTIGNMIPSMALTAVTKNPDIGLAAMGVSAKGQATKEAEEKGSDLSTANEIGLGKGLVEVGTEKLTGGLKFFGKGTADDLVEKGINKAIKNKAGNFIAKQTAGMAGEVGEETISDLVGTAIDKATVDPNASYSFDDWKKTALMTMLSTGALNTISGGYGRKAYQLNAEELNDIAQSKKVQDTVNERVEQFKTPDMTPEQVEQLREQTTAVVLGEIQQNVDDILDSSIAQLQEQPQIPTQTPINTLSSNIQEQNIQTPFQEQTPQITPLNQVNQELQETRQQDVADSVRAMNLEQTPEFTQKQGNYVYEKSDNSKIDTFRKDAATYLKEGEQTDNFVKTLEKIIEDKDIEIRFDPNLRDSQGRMANGSYSNNVITLNPNSNRAGEFLAIHELTHAIGTKSMINMIQKYRKSNAEFDSAVKRLLTTYKATEINEEALGDIAGQLFGNQEYINNLSMENPSLFKKIYNEIKYLWHQFTGYKNQDQFIEDLRNKWESAYRNSKAKQTTKTGYSINEDTGLLQDSKGNTVTLETSNIGNTGTLMAMHNISEDKFNGVLDLDGIPVPSIAITNPSKVNHSQFGEGTLIFGKSTIDPAVRENEVYDRDVWSPTFPQIDYELNDDAIGKVADELGIEKWRLRDAAEDNSKPEYLIERLLREEKLIDKYVEDNNLKYETAYKDAETKVDFHQRGDKIRKFIIDNDFDFKKLYKDKNLQQEYFNLIKDYYDNSSFPEAVKENLYNEKITQLKDFIDIQKGAGDVEPIRQLKRYQDDFDLIKSGENKAVDTWQTDKNKKDAAIKNGIEDYLKKQVKDIYGEKGIRNDKDYLDSRGNRRSFWQLHDEYNLENIVDALTQGDTTGTQNWFAGFGQIQANMANRFNSISDIKANENRITSLAENNTILEEARNNIENDIDEIVEKNDTDMGIVSELLADFARGDLTIDNFKKLTRDYYQTTQNVPDRLINKIIDDMKALKNLPTDYFEAKPQRAVGLDEIGVAVIPKTWSQETKQRMAEKNIRYVEYDPSIVGDRQRVENKFDDLKFSKDNKTWREYLEKEFPSQGTRTNLQDINERNKPKQENKTTQEEKPQEMPKNEVKQEVKKSYLTSAEQNELDGLKAIENSGFAELTKKEQARMEELEKKSQGYTKKFPELKKTVTQEDTKPLYFKYKDNEISRENNKILNEAKNIVEANNQGRRTKEQWLQVAEYIGSNADIKNSTDLQKLAMETWLASRPNTKDNLNRQGKKYVDFKTNEWFNAMYKGAGVGTDVKMSLEEATDTKGNKVDLKPTGNNTYEQVNVKPTKNQVIPDMSNKVLNIGNEKVSNFYSNITEKSKFITEENREALKDNANLQYYDAITNKETLENAMDKLNNNTEKQVGDFFAKKDFDAEDVATGWILVKRYQDAGNYEAMSNVIEKMREQGTKAGQTVQMYGILQRLTPEGMEYYSQKQLDNAFKKFSEGKSKQKIEQYAPDFTLTAEEHQFIKDTMEKVQNMTDEEQKKVEIAKIVSMLNEKIPPEKGQRLKAWMRIAMLGNPKTQVRNVAGNAIIQPINWVGDVFSATADKIISKKTGKRTIGTTDFGALVQGTKKGFKDAVRDAKTGVDTRDINLDRFEENIGANPFYEKHEGAKRILNPAAKVLNKTNRILGNIMSGGDRIFYQAVYDNSLKNQMKLNKVDTPTQEMMDIAEQEALSRTWNDSNSYTKSVLQIRNAMNKLNVKGYGLGDVLVPFAKTPANLTKAIVDYSPVGLTRTILSDGKKLRNSLENGQYNAQLQHQFADSFGKGIAGSMLWVAAYALAKAGITSGKSDDDKDVSNFMRNTLGIQPYSIKIGDKSFTYDWAQPIAAPFAAMSDYQSLTDKEKKDLGSTIEKMTSSASNILLEQSFLSSIQDVFNSYEGPTAAIKQQIQDLPARATPTFFKQIADLIDPTSRQTFVKGDTKETMKNKVQVKIPGKSKELVEQRDTLGREIKKYGGDEDKLKYAFNVFLNPANTNKGKTSKAAEEIYEVYKATGDKTIMPRQVGYSEMINGESRNLTAKERSEWQKLSGKKIEENVKALTQNSTYKQMSDEDKAAVINGIVNYSFSKAKSDLFDTNISTMYKTAAKKEEQGIPLYDYYIERISKRR